MSDQEDTDARLARLRRETDPIRPRGDFAARVAGAIARESAYGGRRADWNGDLLRSARRLVPVAAVVAALGVVWAAQSERAWDKALAAGTMELDAEW
jgi:hypothetical protein